MSTRPSLSRAALAALGATAIAVPGAIGALAPAATAAPTPARDTAVLADHLVDQEVTWESCTFGRPQFDSVPGLACADITVPRDWNNPKDGNTITIRVSRTKTAGANRQGMALVNPGGPGGSGLIWGPAMAVRAPQLAEQYDFFGFDPRGVGQSTPLVCEYTPKPGDDDDADRTRRVEGCLENPLTPFINTEQTVHDMDFIRAVMGEKKLSYIGYSYGTWLGSWYERVFPQHTHRFLLDSATDLTRKSLQETWDLQPRSRDRQFQDMFLPYIGRNAEMFEAPSSDPMELRRAWEKAGGNNVFLGQIITASYILPAMYNTADYPLAALLTTYFMSTAADTDATTAETRAQLLDLVGKVKASGRLTADQTRRLDDMTANALEDIDLKLRVEKAAQEGTAVTLTNMAFDAIRCQDGPWNSSDGYWDAWLADLQRKAPWIAPFMSAPACKDWPNTATMPNAKGNAYPATLIAQSEFDAATPFEAGERSARQLNNTSFIAVDNEGSHGLYPYGTTCVDDSVDAWFLRGDLPGRKKVCNALPLPLEEETLPVGADLGKPGNSRLKMRTPAVKEANKLVREMLADQAAQETAGR